MQTARAVPSWMRRIVNETELIPIEDLKTHIKTEASTLPELLEQTGNPQELRETLLRLLMQTDRVLDAMRRRRQNAELPPLRNGELTSRLAKLAERLPTELNEGSERRRARKLREVNMLCQRMLTILGLTLFLGLCPTLCQIGHVLCAHQKSSSTEFHVAP